MTELLRREAALRRAVERITPHDREHLITILTMAAADRARAISILYESPRFRTLAELMIDLEEEPAARALVVGELREFEQGRRGKPSWHER